MKKLKIIEKSRFLDKDDMKEIQGGTTCSRTNPYSTSGCASGWIGYITCTPPASTSATGYESHNCNLAGDLHTCAADMNFSISSCWGWTVFTSNCSGGNNYSR